MPLHFWIAFQDELKGALIVADSMSAPLKRIAVLPACRYKTAATSSSHVDGFVVKANAGQNGELVAEKAAARTAELNLLLVIHFKHVLCFCRLQIPQTPSKDGQWNAILLAPTKLSSCQAAGFDALLLEYADMLESAANSQQSSCCSQISENLRRGIIDPAKVRSVL